MELNSKNVSSIFTECLFTDQETFDKSITDSAIVVEGVNLKVGFHPDRLQKINKILWIY